MKCTYTTCIKSSKYLNTSRVSVSSLQGTHLTPVYSKIGIDDLDIPDEAQDQKNSTNILWRSRSNE